MFEKLQNKTLPSVLQQMQGRGEPIIQFEI
jgi:hypothetical protein